MRLRRSVLGAAGTMAAMLLAGSLPPAAPARAMTLQQAQLKLKSIQDQLKQDRAALRQTRQSISQKRNVISVIHSHLQMQTSALTQLENQIATLGHDIAYKKSQVQGTDQTLQQDRAAVGKTLQAIDEEGAGGYLNVLLGAQSFNDFVVRLQMVSQVVSADEQEMAKVRTLEGQLKQAEQSLRSKQSELRSMATVKAQEKTALAQQINDQQRAVSALDASYRQYTSAVHSDEGNSKEIEQIIQALESRGTGKGINGIHFIWPVVGPITSPFGMRLDPVKHKWWLHTGIDIGVWYNTPIHAAASGTVIVAQWITGYGNTVIIDDGGGVSNLYAHQERLAVHAGEKVRRGQVIGYVGATGWATGPHLHFEVRIDGKPVNPMPYMPKKP